MRTILIFLSAFFIHELQGFSDIFNQVRHSIVKIQVTSQQADFHKPWQSGPVESASGTGFYIGNGRVMTNAHVVANAKHLSILKEGDPVPYVAYVEFIGHDCDLAIIRPLNTGIFVKTKALQWGGVPKAQSNILTMGFPIGGDQLSITKGIVSRIGFRQYAHTAYHSHLLVQVDSAINPGNSGGPVLQDGKVVGVAFQSNRGAENTGYIIPTPVIERFLNDIKYGHYEGHPYRGIISNKWTLSNEGTLAFHGLKEKQGIKVTFVTQWSCAKGVLLPDDILLSVDGFLIGIDGKVEYNNERVDYSVLLDFKLPGENIKFDLLRGGKKETLSFKIPLQPKVPFSGESYIRQPKFFIVDGLVFTVLSQSYLSQWNQDWQNSAPLILRHVFLNSVFDTNLDQRKEFVVLSERLPDQTNAFVKNQLQGVVDSVDSVKILDLKDFANRVKNSTQKFVIIRFLGSCDPIYIQKSTMVENLEKTKKQYQLPLVEWLADEEDGAVVRKDLSI